MQYLVLYQSIKNFFLSDIVAHLSLFPPILGIQTIIGITSFLLKFSMIRKYRCLLTVLVCLFTAYAQADSHIEKLRNANNGRIGVVTGGVNGTYIQIGADLGSVLDGVDGLRIITMVGKGSVQNIQDLLYLKGVDIGLVQSDVLMHMERNNPDDEALQKLAYLTKVYNEEVHVLTRTDLNIKSVEDLSGKIVNVGDVGSGSKMTANLLLEFLELNVDETNYGNTDALEMLKEGQIDAMIFVSGKPTSLLKGLGIDDGLELIPVPYTDGLKDVYIDTVFTSEDYPGLVSEKYVETIAVGAILAVYDKFSKNNRRYQNLVKFCENFLANRKLLLKKPRHPKWKELDFEEQVPGWKRFGPMENLLSGNKEQETGSILQTMQN